MTEIELIEEIAFIIKAPKVAVAHVLHGMKQTMKKTLARGESVVLTGFGSLQMRKLKKKPLFGKPQEGVWTKVKFTPSRRRQRGKVRSSAGRREVKDGERGSGLSTVR